MWLDIFFGGGCSVKASLLKISHDDISSELNNVDFDVSLVISGQRWQNCPDTLAFDKSSNSRYMKHFLQLKPPSYRAHESSSLSGSCIDLDVHLQGPGLVPGDDEETHERTHD